MWPENITQKKARYLIQLGISLRNLCRIFPLFWALSLFAQNPASEEPSTPKETLRFSNGTQIELYLNEALNEAWFNLTFFNPFKTARISLEKVLDTIGPLHAQTITISNNSLYEKGEILYLLNLRRDSLYDLDISKTLSFNSSQPEKAHQILSDLNAHSSEHFTILYQDQIFMMDSYGNLFLTDYEKSLRVLFRSFLRELKRERGVTLLEKEANLLFDRIKKAFIETTSRVLSKSVDTRDSANLEEKVEIYRIEDLNIFETPILKKILNQFESHLNLNVFREIKILSSRLRDNTSPRPAIESDTRRIRNKLSNFPITKEINWKTAFEYTSRVVTLSDRYLPVVPGHRVVYFNNGSRVEIIQHQDRITWQHYDASSMISFPPSKDLLSSSSHGSHGHDLYSGLIKEVVLVSAGGGLFGIDQLGRHYVFKNANRSRPLESPEIRYQRIATSADHSSWFNRAAERTGTKNEIYNRYRDNNNLDKYKKNRVHNSSQLHSLHFFRNCRALFLR